jgi:peptidoglycan hydrolase-like protein with peptidoglycan-binding domain
MALKARVVTAAIVAGLCLFGTFGPAGLSSAQTTPATPPPAASDPQFEQQKAAFETLAEADRRAIQDGLMWTGHYLGVVDGAFGKRTRDSIVAWQTAVKAPANGIVTAPQLAALKASAAKAASAAG